MLKMKNKARRPVTSIIKFEPLYWTEGPCTLINIFSLQNKRFNYLKIVVEKTLLPTPTPSGRGEKVNKGEKPIPKHSLESTLAEHWL